MVMDGKTRRAVAANVKLLMEAAGWNQTQLAEKSGVAQRTISNLLRPETGSSTIETVAAVAAALGTEAWVLMLDDITPELARSPALRILVDNYLHASPDGKRALDRIGEAEAAYSADPGRTSSKQR